MKDMSWIHLHSACCQFISIITVLIKYRCYTSGYELMDQKVFLLRANKDIKRASPVPRPSLPGRSYLGQLHAERWDVDLPQPPEGLQSERRGAAGQQLDERQEVEVIITDEELQQDVQGAGEDAVRNGHGDPQQPALEHVHGGWSR